LSPTCWVIFFFNARLIKIVACAKNRIIALALAHLISARLRKANAVAINIPKIQITVSPFGVSIMDSRGNLRLKMQSAFLTLLAGDQSAIPKKEIIPKIYKTN
jgi:hypothetical protein